MNEPREWHELVEAEEALRPTRVINQRTLYLRYRGSGCWAWDPRSEFRPHLDFDMDGQDVARALCRDKATEWLAERGYYVACGSRRDWWLDKPRKVSAISGYLDSDRDTAIRMAVEAVLEQEAKA